MNLHNDPPPIEVRLNYHARTGAGDLFDCPESYVLSVYTEISGSLWSPTTEFYERSFSLGQLKFYLVRIGNALADECDLFDVFDRHQELSTLADAIFNPDCSRLRNAVLKQYPGTDGEQDLLFVSNLALEPFARGQRLGLYALVRMIRDWSSGCSLVVIKPFPLQGEQLGPEDADWQRLALGQYRQSIRRAIERLREYIKPLDFTRILRTPYFGFNPQLDLIAVESLELRNSIRLPYREIAARLNVPR